MPSSAMKIIFLNSLLLLLKILDILPLDFH